MIGIGAIACIWPFVSSATYLTETTDLNFIQTAKLHARELCLALGFIIGGISIFKKQVWARKLCLTVLALAFFYGGNKISWLLESPAATTTTLASAYLLSFLLFGICFFVLFQYLTEENLTSSN